MYLYAFSVNLCVPFFIVLMKIRSTWGAVGLVLVMGLLAVWFYRPAQATQTVCVTRMPEPGGFLVEGIVGRPQTLNPLLDQNNVVDR